MLKKSSSGKHEIKFHLQGFLSLFSVSPGDDMDLRTEQVNRSRAGQGKPPVTRQLPSRASSGLENKGSEAGARSRFSHRNCIKPVSFLRMPCADTHQNLLPLYTQNVSSQGLWCTKMYARIWDHTKHCSKWGGGG